MSRFGPKPRHIPKSVMDFAWEYIIDHEKQFRVFLEKEFWIPDLRDDFMQEFVPRIVAYGIMDYQLNQSNPASFMTYIKSKIKIRIRQWIKRELHKWGSWRHESIEILMKTSKRMARHSQLDGYKADRDISIEDSEEIEILRRWVENNLSEIDAAVYEYYYIDEYTDEEIGKMIGVDRSRVSKRRTKIEQIIYTRKSEIFSKEFASETKS